MVSYRISLVRAARKQLDRLSGRDYQAIASAISSLAHEPRPERVKKLAESGLWRIRVGRQRIVYTIDDESRMIIVVRVVQRSGDTYKRL